MKIKELILALLISVFSTVAYGETFDEEMSKTYTPVDPMTSYSTTTESNWTGWNKFWFTSAIVGQTTDVVSTQQALNRGCVEANPIFGEDPNMGLVILAKAAILGGIYYVTEYMIVGEEDQQDARNWGYGTAALVGFAAGGWNSAQDCN